MLRSFRPKHKALICCDHTTAIKYDLQEHQKMLMRTIENIVRINLNCDFLFIQYLIQMFNYNCDFLAFKTQQTLRTFNFFSRHKIKICYNQR